MDDLIRMRINGRLAIYKPGDRVALTRVRRRLDPPVGSVGTVLRVDPFGSIHLSLDGIGPYEVTMEGAVRKLGAS